MKILMVSMNSIHFRRWTSQLEDSGHEVFWFDALGAEGSIKELLWVTQKTDWRLRLKKGRYWIKKLPFLHKINERSMAQAFEAYLEEVKPDVVHSFVLYMSCFPILEVMKRNKRVKWIYSAWGNDLFFYQNVPKYKAEIDAVLPHVDYMFADCKRDLELAKKLGLKGEILGDFPGGGGYHLDLIGESIKPITEREGILVKGYQGEKHRGLNVLKALELMLEIPPATFFSTDESLLKYYEGSDNLKQKDITFITASTSVSHKSLCQKMNSSLIYVGNNVSDGMPNTLLEAICFGAFPIQSNPGGASAEVIVHGKNGFLINDCEDIQEIKRHLEKVLKENVLVEEAFDYNMDLRNNFSFENIKTEVLKAYQKVKNRIEK